MRSLILACTLGGVFGLAGCSLANDFGEFSFDGPGEDETDAGRDAGASGGGGSGGGGSGGSGGSSGRDGGSDAGANDAEVDGGDAQVDAGPGGDPICEAAMCDEVASCDSSSGAAVCECPSGYFDFHDDGMECVDLNECQAGLHQCDDDATCFNSQGGYDCVCNPGFVRNEGSDDCIDSCVLLLAASCDPDVGLCIKPTGEASCRCPAGYVDLNGDGSECEPDPECMALGCDPLALCDSDPGPAECTCPEGYDDVNGDGTECVDLDECTLGTHDCDENADCTNTEGGFICTCAAGFTGDGKSCEDVDECSANTDGCSMRATCVNEVGGYDCDCNPGYSGNGFACTDVNECTLGTAECSPNADCTNTIGGYTCACKSGYTGDGETCEDVDECAEGLDDCSASDGCTNTPGSYTCGCQAGYRKNSSGECVDVDECEEDLDNCSVNAACTNTAGSFTCECNDGYAGNGVTCTDVDECEEDLDDCSENATCTNIAGSFTCECNDGYTGNGVTCTDVNECEDDLDNCHPTRGQCTNTPGSFTCACIMGYAGNGVTCTDVNECADNTDTCDSQPDACVNTTGSYSCACPSGYTGNGQGQAGCTDIDECAQNTDGCDDSPNACSNTPGGFVCTCPSGWVGDGRGPFGCCDPDGTNTDVTHPNDGRDNECDGLWDRPLIQAENTFPKAQGASSAAGVAIQVTPSAIAGAALQCRSYKRSSASVPAWGACPNPIRLSASSTDPANDGAWRTEIRWSYSGGRLSHVTTHDYYVHHSMHNAPACPSLYELESAIFEAAHSYLAASLVRPGYTDPGNFHPSETVLHNPFVRIGFRPLTSGYFSLQRADVSAPGSSTGAIPYSANILSLRKRFVAGANGRYILIYRTHVSRRAYESGERIEQCDFGVEVNDSNYAWSSDGGWQKAYRRYRCDAIVVNRAGAGVCVHVNLDTKEVTIDPPHSNKFGAEVGYSTSDKFMWLHLLDERGWHGKWSRTLFPVAPETGFRHFSEKCFTAGCNSDNENELYLPDRPILLP